MHKAAFRQFLSGAKNVFDKISHVDDTNKPDGRCHTYLGVGGWSENAFFPK